MYQVCLIDWNMNEIEQRSIQLANLGYVVDAASFDNLTLQKIKNDPPNAVVIALDRRPAQGRDIGLYLRKTKATRLVPLVFVGGDAEKFKHIQEHLPDATYTRWENIGVALNQAIVNPPVDPVVPKSLFDPYQGTPLPKKLGIKTGCRVALIDAPDDFMDTLGEIPENVKLVNKLERDSDIIIWFVKQKSIFEERLLSIARMAETGSIWVVWPKKSSGVSGDLSQPVVRKIGLAAGLVDYKVCSVDQTWTGLCFRWRKE